MKKIIFMILILMFNFSYSQTYLNEGDIAIITVNSSNESFDFVTFVDLRPGTKIYFTDEGWDGSDFVTNEKTIMFSTDSLIRSGSIFSTKYDNSFFGNDNLILNNTGDNIIAYQVKDGVNKFIYGIAWGATNQWITSGIPTSANSYIPSNLSTSENTIVQLGTKDNYQYNSNSTGNIDLLLQSINNSTNWNNSETSFHKNNLVFKVLGLNPTFYLLKDNQLCDESTGVFSFNVTVSYPSSTNNMQVDVIFDEGNSTANTADISPPYIKTLTFPANSFSDQTVEFSINDDSIIENKEICKFYLANPRVLNEPTSAVIDTPNVYTLYINDNELPDIVINEFLPSPNSDVNNDGITSSSDEFIELINNCGIDYYFDDIEIHDAKGLTHRFPENTLVPKDESIVIFSGGTPQNIPCITQVSSEGSLSLNNTGDKIILYSPDGTIINQHQYSSSSSDISWAKNPDITGSFVKHTNIATNNVHYSPGKRNINGQPLPVELIFFEGKVQQNSIILTWETATEINNYGFELQNLTDNNWQKLAFIKGYGNSNSNKKYVYEFPVNQFNKSYISRLKQIDFDGKFEILDTLKIFVPNNIHKISFSTYPNPFNNVSNLEVSLNKPGKLKIGIYNSIGEKLFTNEKEIATPGVFNFEYNLSNYSSGFYIYRINFNGENYILKTLLIK